MAPRTATFFSLALFPQVFLFRRMLSSDVVFALGDRWLDDKNHANQCLLRSATGGTQKIEIPVCKKGVPIDDVNVPECSTWFPEMQKEVRRIYGSLPLASAASALLSQSRPPFTSPWLIDYLMHSFVMTLNWLGWEKEIVRGPRVRRQRYVVDSEYLLDLCLEYGCQRLMVGAGQEMKYRTLFRSEGVSVIGQQWRGSAALPVRDSILDAAARLSPADILRNMQRN